VAIAGATGYTGAELIRILYNHPEVEIVRITSERSAGFHFSAMFPQFRSLMDLTFEPLDPDGISTGVDLVFLALPHTDSMHVTPRVRRQNVPVVDLSGDFRLNQAKVYTEWYKVDHAAPDEMEKGIYGLPELNREKIQGARFVANPGCYPTASLLGVAPLLKDSLIHLDGIIIDAKSGVTGAGKSPKPHLHFPEANEALTAYKVAEHQHTPEIEQEMSRLAGQKVEINLTTHLIPMSRGVLCTIYAALDQKVTTDQLIGHYKEYYRGEPFVRILPAGTYPNTKNVRGANACDIGLKVDSRTGRVIVISAIDNLVKGASGQAIQNMNLMLGLDETTGLKLPAMTP
ncbi:MAG: N-acetyl-gamma-glutamyl-phosphate reductase, partial [bacterium]|nr:N-acetyl-gamma-glutamyl-phosphate reductase [bacterium]